LAGSRPNRLAAEKSPYLLKHALNPVDWYPWGDEALKKAKNDGKPIFLSIGYSTCHWCTVMEHESFEDEKVAAFINKSFIAIKVDREERPEVDAYYMGAVQAMTGGGGWPLSVFLTPELKPFYGGTYYPPEPRYGVPSFSQVLEFVAKTWKENRAQVVEGSAQIAAALEGGSESREKLTLSLAVLDEGYSSVISSFDSEHGGFGGAPKFPLPLTSAFLLRYHYRTGKELALKSVLKTLDEMLAGGIRDHLGGGFHRYSTDRVWLVPHFEKMLYDNALVSRLLAEAYQVTKREEYSRGARETLGWMLRELASPEGGFYSAQDADTEDGEGYYYTWDPAEVGSMLGAERAEAFCRAYGVTKNGNFEGRSILHLTVPPSEVGEALRKSAAQLYEARLKRPRPATDTKILTSWNGLAVSAFAVAGEILGDAGLGQAAARAAEFVLSQNSRDGRLLRRFAGGEAALEGTLEDYAFFVGGLLDLFEATQEPKWLREAIRLAGDMVDDFEDKDRGGFYLTVGAVPARLKEGYDGPTPSGNSMAALDLIRLAEFTGEHSFRKSADGTLQWFGRDLEQQPSGHTCMLTAADLALNGMMEVVIASKDPGGAAAFRREVSGRFIPDKVLLLATADSYGSLSKLSALLEGREPGAKARAYVCRRSVCKLPADTPEVLRAQLAAGQG
jgi:uncharacterized protein